MSKYGIGQPVLRFEDPRLLRGQGRFVNDINLHGQTYAVFVRSPHAHAHIRSIDTKTAGGFGDVGLATREDGTQVCFDAFADAHAGRLRQMIRQVRDLDHTIVAQCCGKGDGIVEFADIAWPAMVEKQQPRCAR